MKNRIHWVKGIVPDLKAHAIRPGLPSRTAMCGCLVTLEPVNPESSPKTPACPFCAQLSLAAVTSSSQKPVRPRKLPPRDSYPRRRKQPPIAS
jgi:hypothetical protein